MWLPLVLLLVWVVTQVVRARAAVDPVAGWGSGDYLSLAGNIALGVAVLIAFTLTSTGVVTAARVFTGIKIIDKPIERSACVSIGIRPTDVRTAPGSSGNADTAKTRAILVAHLRDGRERSVMAIRCRVSRSELERVAEKLSEYCGIPVAVER